MTHHTLGPWVRRTAELHDTREESNLSLGRGIFVF